MSRIKAREAAFALVYEWELNGEPEHDALQVLRESVEVENIEDDDIPYIEALAHGCRAHAPQLDALIVKNLVDDWKLDRLPKVDLALLRIGIHELLYDKSIPVPVVMDQCVELAKRYSTDKSGAFVHGVLSSVARQMESDVLPGD